MSIRLSSLAALVVLALAGCAAPAPAPSPSVPVAEPSASSSATSEPEPSELVIRGGGVELYDSEGALVGSFVWADETGTALAVLEQAFGEAPAPGFVAGDGSHYADFETYDFGALVYFSAVGLGKPRAEYFLPSSVRVDAGESVDGVLIRTAAGIGVGDDDAAVLALSPPLSYPHPPGTAFLIDPVDPAVVSDPENATDMVGVVVADGLVWRIIAPYPSRTFV